MYSEVFGGYQPELISEFDREPLYGSGIDEFDLDIMETPTDKPYAFCDEIKHSEGKEK